MSEATAKAFITDPAGSTSAADVRDAIGTIYTDLSGGGGIASPTEISDLVLWLEADAIGGADNDPVSTWADSSAQSNDATQGTGSAQPTLKTAVLNGHDVVRFDGGDYLTTGTLVSHDSLAVFIVCNKTSGTGDRGLFVTDHYGMYSSLNLSGAPWGAFLATRRSGNFALDSTYALLRGLFCKPGVNATGSISISTIEQTVFNGAQDTRTSTGIGADGAGAQFHIGDIAEIVVYNRLMSPWEVGLVETYLIDKYAL